MLYQALNHILLPVSGCNFRCGFCQNWQISQKKITSDDSQAGFPRSPEQIIQDAIQNKCESISFTYTEPTIFFEYAFEIAKEAKKAGLKTIFVSNGFMTPQTIETVKSYLDACNIDLKSFKEEFYKKFCQGHLRPVLDSIKRLHDSGIWIEITTLLISGENDSPEEINEIASFIASIDKNIPWHISRFFPQFEFVDHEATQINTIKKAEKIGKDAGLNYVYAGNIPEEAKTVCPKCSEILINRDGYKIKKNVLNYGRCPNCESEIPGIWS